MTVSFFYSLVMRNFYYDWDSLRKSLPSMVDKLKILTTKYYWHTVKIEIEMNYSVKKVTIIRCFCLLSLFLINSQFIYSLVEDEIKKIVVLEDGTTIINTYNYIGKHLKEEIILRNGRHKTTFFDIDEQPKYGTLYTGTGAFGLMYYDQSMAPLFKFYDYGNDNKEIYFLSKEFEKIDTIKLFNENEKRKIDIKKEDTIDNQINKNYIYSLWELLIGILFGVILSKTLLKRREKNE